MCCTQLVENTAHKKSPKIRHRRIIAQLCRAVSSLIRHVSTIRKKNLLNSNISSTCPHNMANFSPLVAEIGLGVWGTPANFNGFRVLPSLLQQHCSPEANQTLHDVWLSAGLVHYMHFWGLLSADGILPGAKFTLRPFQVLHFPILAALLHGTWAAGISQTLSRGTRNGITELLHGAPPIFCGAAITLGIVPHSSSD